MDDLDSIKERLTSLFGEGILTQEQSEKLYDDKVNYILTVHKSHQNRKKALGYRIHVLRVLIRHLHGSKRLSMKEFEFNIRVDKYLDNLLFKFKYRLESAIIYVRELICST